MGNVLLYETGIDRNEDRHCDLCGWFVDEYESHRARLASGGKTLEQRPEWSKADHHLESLSAEEFADRFIRGNPYSRPDWSPSSASSVLRYSNNDANDLSCAVINGYLREGELDPRFSEEEIAKAISDMDSAISGFVAGKTFTVYRGMHFEPGDPFLGKLDAAIEAMKETRTPAELIDQGFMSTTRSVETMEAYAKKGKAGLCHVYMSVTIEPGVAAMPLSVRRCTAANNEDKEVLLRSGQPCYIIGIRKTYAGEDAFDYHVNLLITNRRLKRCS